MILSTRVIPSGEDLLTLSRALIADPDRECLQLIARGGRKGVGSATIYWMWSTTQASRLGVMNDLFVTEGSRARVLLGLSSMPVGRSASAAACADSHADRAGQPSRPSRV
jgi:hypothetical protein